ncbi:EAL domain-containing protein [Alteromonas mediterranea]|uniref:Sensory box/GGDEF family protein n=3 Tax=Alteromonas mediterranea TaxID=314275 RepID=S5ADF5_9ALTE|nr:EAL domain-containing protein [Alteromonas mediterranea]AGP76786.1 sensory box/GGDEF family protein [Alteromonas mediterranea 615]MBR9897973.1 EAL domain-containing protein [Gammaproteobacteria bacterium]
MIAKITKIIKNYLLLNDDNLKTTDANIWRLSVLRTILLIGVILTSAIVIHSSYTAYVQELYYVMYLTLGFSAFLFATLAIGLKHIKLASACLVLAVVGASLCILFFTLDLMSARYGLLLLFTLPIIVRVLYGVKASIASMLLNFIPFYLLLNNTQLSPLFGIDITLPDTHTYLASLIFLFFNFCIPMAVLRVMSSLERQAEHNLLQSKKLNKLVSRYQEIFNNGGTPSFFCDDKGRILQANKAARALLKRHNPDGEYIQDLFALSLPITRGVNQLASICNAPEREFKLQPASLEHHKKQLIHCHDLSASKKNMREFDAFKKQQFEKLYVNELTGLKNHHFWKKTESSESILNRHIVLLKLANLREVNLQYGYSQGDQLLLRAAALLQSELPTDVSIYQFPGAKFLFTLNTKHLAQKTIEEYLARKLPSSMMIDSASAKVEHPLSWRVGHYHATREINVDAAAECCAIALSQSSELSPIVSFSVNTVKTIRENTQQKDNVKMLLDNGCLALYLQPQVDINGNIVGYEILARLKEPKTGTVLQPYQFLPLVEQNKWEVLFTQKIIDGTLELIKSWPAGLPPVPLAINLSGPELLSDLFYEKLLRRYSESPELGKRLKLELTETSVLASHNETKRRLTSLSNVGATIIIDDFGTGHASLSQLIDMSASIIKVDREFVERVETSERHRKIVKMTLDLAKSLEMQTIAEGVETRAQLSVLKDMGFKHFQGYLFGKPAPIEHWISASKAQA